MSLHLVGRSRSYADNRSNGTGRKAWRQQIHLHDRKYARICTLCCDHWRTDCVATYGVYPQLKRCTLERYQLLEGRRLKNVPKGSPMPENCVGTAEAAYRLGKSCDWLTNQLYKNKIPDSFRLGSGKNARWAIPELTVQTLKEGLERMD